MKKLTSIIIIIVSIIFIAFCWSSSKNDANNANMQANQEAIAKKNYNKKQNSIIKALRYHATNSKDPKVRAYSQNQLNMKSVSSPIKTFLQIDYNWSNESDYKARNGLASSYATPNVIRIPTIFGSDRGAIHDEGLHSRYLSSHISVISRNGDNIKVLVGCNHLSWSTDANQSANDGITGQQWFVMNFNLDQGKITHLDKLYENTNINN